MTKHIIRGGLGLILVLVLAISFSVPAQAIRRYSYTVSQDFVGCMSRPAIRYQRGKRLAEDDCHRRIQVFLDFNRTWRIIRGDDVSDWPWLRPDGLYGRDTAKAVAAYQKSKSGGLTVDGVTGIRTWLNIYNDCVLQWSDDDIHSDACFAKTNGTPSVR